MPGTGNEKPSYPISAMPLDPTPSATAPWSYSDDPDVTLIELSKLIELDVALSVQILRIANSALYSPVSEISTIERALTTLGLRSVRLLALSTSLRMLIPDQAEAFDTSEIRRRMVISGSLARRVCNVLAKPQQDEAFLAGLLTGLGRVVLAEKAPALCRVLTADGGWPTADVEQRIMGFTTDQVSVGLIGSWGLPLSICEAIERRSLEPLGTDSPLTTSLQLARLVEEVLCSGRPEVFLPQLYEMTNSLLGMSPEDTNAWVGEAEPLVADDHIAKEFVAKLGGAFVLFMLDGFSELFLQRLPNRVLAPQRFT